MSDDEADEQTRAQLRRGLRIAVLLVTAATTFALGLPAVLRNLGRFDVPALQVVAFGALAAVLAAEAVLVARRRPWRRARWLAIAVVLAATVLSYTDLPHNRTSTGVDWVFGVANWIGLVVLLDRPFRTQMAFLVTHEVLALANLLLFHDVSRGSLARFATGSVTVFGLPLCIAVVAAVLRRIGTEAAAATRELERVRTAEAVAVTAHRRRAQRFAELSTTTVPLLEGLAAASLDPSTPEVRQRCSIEAARMRRLFAETDAVANPLLHELRHCADIADRKGVEVEFDARGTWPVPPVPVRRALTDAALTALATASSWARVTVVGSAEEVSVNVVADCDEPAEPVHTTPDVRVETFGGTGKIWTEATWQPMPT
ncbi:hypothetical protein [Actinophytocola sp. NPDC049390]|uniref:hypothetical protein n=1 Tax=Actinophytocola sp. NPDC049390 TaxID=3363894 RepID=UPI0037BCCC67